MDLQKKIRNLDEGLTIIENPQFSHLHVIFKTLVTVAALQKYLIVKGLWVTT